MTELITDCLSLTVRINFHGDELHPLGGAELGGELRAEAVSHLEEVSLESGGSSVLPLYHFPPRSVWRG